jgi:hypothetical protein
MGFRAPSADEVYRYALRLDEDRSLTDRFGFSIVFVTDGSPVCREFLHRYGIDLCLRTADRIRFVFFSDLPHGTLETTVERERIGPLRVALSLFGRRSSFDFEEEPWRSLRPEAFEPLADVAEVREGLGFDVQMFAAMPGVGAAMQFAQRLGIGRHVPCLLVFTEIGALHVDLLPIDSLTPEEVFTHAREWIDGFYEENRESIAHWSDVENEVGRLVSESRTRCGRSASGGTREQGHGKA